jgi:4-hydroxy-tetrahydrodipicolinate synthase
LLERVPHLSILVGHEPFLPRLMRAGGAGTICGVANVFPREVLALLAAGVAREDEARVVAFIDILFRYPFLPAFKAILAEQVGDDGWRTVRVPQYALSEPQRIALLDQLRSTGLLAAREAAQ